MGLHHYPIERVVQLRKMHPGVNVQIGSLHPTAAARYVLYLLWMFQTEPALPLSRALVHGEVGDIILPNSGNSD